MQRQYKIDDNNQYRFLMQNKRQNLQQNFLQSGFINSKKVCLHSITRISNNKIAYIIKIAQSIGSKFANMKKQDYQQFQRRNQLFQNQTKQNDNKKELLEKQLQFQKLYEECTLLIKTIQERQEQNHHLKQTLKNLIPQNSWLKKAFQDVKATLNSIQNKEQEFLEQLNQKDRLIQDLKSEIETLNQSSDLRKSNLSNMGQLINSLQEKTKLQDEIQEMKKERLINNEKYEQKLQKKDEIIKKINQQSQQAELYYKDLVSKKSRIIQSLEQELKQRKKVNQQLASQLKNDQASKPTFQSQLCKYRQEIRKLNSLADQLNQQLSQMTMQNQEIARQNMQLKRQNQSVKLQNQHVRAQSESIHSQIEKARRQNEKQVQNSTNFSRQIDLKEQYLRMLEQSRSELTRNQLQLKKTFSLLQNKDSENRFKEQEIYRLKNSILNYQQSQAYFQKSASDLQKDKVSILRKLQDKDQSIRNLENQIQQYQHQIGQKMLKIQALERENRQISKLQTNNYSLKAHLTPIQKPSSNEHFFDCNNQKEILEEQLRQTQKLLNNEQLKSESYLNEIRNLTKLNHAISLELQSVKGQPYENQKNNKNESNYDKNHIQSNLTDQVNSLKNEIRHLKHQNSSLKQKLNEKSTKLQQKTIKMQKIQSQMRHEYEARVKCLQKQIYRLTQVQQKSSHIQKQLIINTIGAEELMIDDLDGQFQLGLQNEPKTRNFTSHPKSQFQNLQLNEIRQANVRNSIESKASTPKNAQIKSNKSQKNSADLAFKEKYQEIKAQNQSLRAHMQRLSDSLSQNKERLNSAHKQNEKLQDSVQLMQKRAQIAQKQSKLLQDQVAQSKQDLQRFQSLKQLLKIQKTQSKQKSQTIKQLEQRLSELQKSQKQLQQDYHNLESINEETNQKYKKTLQSFKHQMTQMNQQILKQKGNIQDKKRQMKRVENQHVSRIQAYEDQNMVLKSKLKKQQLQMTKLQQKLHQWQEEQIEKVIITRTQFINYKQTEKRVQEIQQQINSLLKDKDKIISQKKSLENYYQEELSLVKNNYSTERERLLRKLTESEQSRSENQVKLNKLKEILQKKRKQNIQSQGNLQKLTKQNYHIKLELSQALSQANTQLIKNKALLEKLAYIENQLQEVKMAYQSHIVQKSKNQKTKMTTNGMKVELEMTYKQIEKLNDVLMQKQKQINFFLNQPGPDTYNHKDKYQGMYDNTASQQSYEKLRQKNDSRQFCCDNELSFGHKAQPHYKSSRGDNYGSNDYVKQNSYKYGNPRGTKEPEETFPRQKIPTHHQNRAPQKFFGGFPAKYCSFAPEYHKI